MKPHFTPEQRERFCREVEARRRHRLWASLVLLVAVVGPMTYLWLRGAPAPRWLLLVILIPLVAVVQWFGYSGRQCPNCGKYIGRTYRPQYCPYCAAPLS